MELLWQVAPGTVDLAFADPPFNIGYDYDQYDDQLTADEYVEWSMNWMREIHRALKPSGTFWLAIGDEHAADLKVAAERHVGFTTRSWIVWYYTFGVNCVNKFTRSHAHLFHFVKDAEDFTFNAQDPAVRVPSARALVYGDKRANPKGRLPDDTWILRPQDAPEGFQPMDDTWYFARVAGTFKERQGFHGCQMPEQLLGRIIRVSSNPGDLVLDPFAGSGTTLAVAKKLGRDWLGCEISADYAAAANARLAAIKAGVALDGPADPIASAPSTAAGRRLPNLPEKRPSEPRDTTPTPTAVPPTASAPANLREHIAQALIDSFDEIHDGHSIDWLLADPQLQAAFHDACRERGLIGQPADWNHRLIGLRKAGKFPKHGNVRTVHTTSEAMDAYNFAAEIAWQKCREKFPGASIDEIFCDPQKATSFDRLARRYAPGFEPCDYRWAALKLRKARSGLVAEAKKFDYVLATRNFQRFQNWSRCRCDRWNSTAGVYLLRGDRKRPLYIGESLDLGLRLERHAQAQAITWDIEHVAIIPEDELPSSEYRELLKVDLVRRYKPLLNVNFIPTPTRVLV